LIIWALTRQVLRVEIALPDHLIALGGAAGGIVADEHRFALAPDHGLVTQAAFAFQGIGGNFSETV
jgi:hypothetical protein